MIKKTNKIFNEGKRSYRKRNKLEAIQINYERVSKKIDFTR